mmetsp:Transcript_19252/g.39778  ORF Transcript_19252/g.39778 Transcript_19252/m.39778 type:complete len:369 (+) Transcript_19252:186-1292(+)
MLYATPTPSGTTSPQPQLSNFGCVRWLVLILQVFALTNVGLEKSLGGASLFPTIMLRPNRCLSTPWPLPAIPRYPTCAFAASLSMATLLLLFSASASFFDAASRLRSSASSFFLLASARLSSAARAAETLFSSLSLAASSFLLLISLFFSTSPPPPPPKKLPKPPPSTAAAASVPSRYLEPDVVVTIMPSLKAPLVAIGLVDTFSPSRKASLPVILPAIPPSPATFQLLMVGGPPLVTFAFAFGVGVEARSDLGGKSWKVGDGGAALGGGALVSSCLGGKSWKVGDDMVGFGFSTAFFCAAAAAAFWRFSSAALLASSLLSSASLAFSSLTLSASILFSSLSWAASACLCCLAASLASRSALALARRS